MTDNSTQARNDRADQYVQKVLQNMKPGSFVFDTIIVDTTASYAAIWYIRTGRSVSRAQYLERVQQGEFTATGGCNASD